MAILVNASYLSPNCSFTLNEKSDCVGTNLKKGNVTKEIKHQDVELFGAFLIARDQNRCTVQ